ncbi:MAG: hypothetical protein KME21_17150 [Desmonostoc vinosum HA7617-LM4]|nr:hypothetical protein [Desmonostoc vinosum HA7617-LM4]
MTINFTKRLFILANIIVFIFFLPGIALASPEKFHHVNSSTIFAQSNKTVDYFSSSSNTDLTPQQRQQIQAVHQRRNREIAATLDSSQRTELIHKLRSGENINQALETINLQPEQRKLIEAIIQFTNLKMKAVLSRYSLKIQHQNNM